MKIQDFLFNKQLITGILFILSVFISMFYWTTLKCHGNPLTVTLWHCYEFIPRCRLKINFSA